MSDDVNLNPRQVARRRVLQGLYAWFLTQDPMRLIQQDVMSVDAQEGDTKPCDQEYFHELLQEIPKHRAALEEAIGRYASRSMASINPVERAALLIGAYELIHRLEIPFKVVINEAVNMVKSFGATDSYRFVNGVLDKLATEVRSTPKG